MKSTSESGQSTGTQEINCKAWQEYIFEKEKRRLHWRNQSSSSAATAP